MTTLIKGDCLEQMKSIEDNSVDLIFCDLPYGPFRYDLVWCKSSSTGALSSKRQPLRSHEMLYFFYEKLPFYDLSSHKSKCIDKEITEECDTAYGKIKIKPPKTAGSRYEPPLPNSLLQIKSTRTKHSTEKPVDLMKWILKYYSKENDVILDPTMGSGSMGVACKEMNREFIGIEKDDEIFKVAESRIN